MTIDTAVAPTALPERRMGFTWRLHVMTPWAVSSTHDYLGKLTIGVSAGKPWTNLVNWDNSYMRDATGRSLRKR